MEHSSTTESKGFADLGLEKFLLDALERLHFDAPTEVQIQTIPHALEGRDCLIRVSSGMGKTNAYLLPVLQRVTPGEGLQALVIQPTRSLAMQIEKHFRRLAEERPTRVGNASGDRGRDRDRRAPSRPPAENEILVATIRGMQSLDRGGDFDYDNLRMLVIDEVDTILEEFGDERLGELLEKIPEECQIVLLGADMDDDVRAFAEDWLNDSASVDVGTGAPRALAAEQRVCYVGEDERFNAFLGFCHEAPGLLVVAFTQTVEQAEELRDRLDAQRINTRFIDSTRTRGPRDRRPRGGGRNQLDVIIAHDPAARRLSTIPAARIVHYFLPDAIDAYVRRLEHCTRIRRNGVVVALAEEAQRELIGEIEGKLEITMQAVDAPEYQRPEPRARDDRGGDRGGDRGRGRDRGGDRGGRGAPRGRREGGRDGGRGGRGERREGGGRRDERRSGGDRGGPPRSAEKPRPKPRAKPAKGRLMSLLHHDPELEARGVEPMPRTLGSRFRTTRGSRPIRR